MLLCLLVAAVIALMILQLRKIKADSGKTPDDDNDDDKDEDEDDDNNGDNDEDNDDDNNGDNDDNDNDETGWLKECQSHPSLKENAKQPNSRTNNDISHMSYMTMVLMTLQKVLMKL